MFVLKGEFELKENVSGFVVDFPLKFLSKEKNFFPDKKAIEGILPTSFWT